MPGYPSSFAQRLSGTGPGVNTASPVKPAGPANNFNAALTGRLARQSPPQAPPGVRQTSILAGGSPAIATGTTAQGPTPNPRIPAAATRRKLIRIAVAMATITVLIGLGVYFGRGSVLWQRVAASMGSAENGVALGWRYREGNGVTQDFSKSAQWFEQAAGLGSARAQYDLGVLYYYGLGVPVSENKAKQCFEKAAGQNYAPAITKLGSIAMGSERDSAKAMKLWWNAAKLHDPWGEYLLGAAYLQENDKNDQNIPRALYWVLRGL